LTASAQQSELKEVNGFKFGATKEETKTLIASKGWKMLETKQAGIINLKDIKIGTIPISFATFSFFENRLYSLQYIVDAKYTGEISTIIIKKYKMDSADIEKTEETVMYNWSFRNNRAITLFLDLEKSTCSLLYIDDNINDKKKLSEKRLNNQSF